MKWEFQICAVMKFNCALWWLVCGCWGAEAQEKCWGQRWLNVAHSALPEQANEAAVYDPLQLCHHLNGNKMPAHTYSHSNTPNEQRIHTCTRTDTHTHTQSRICFSLQTVVLSSVSLCFSEKGENVPSQNSGHIQYLQYNRTISQVMIVMITI